MIQHRRTSSNFGINQNQNNHSKSATMNYNNKYIHYVSINRTYGYGQYTMRCEWIDTNGESQSHSIHSTDSELFDDYRFNDADDENYQNAKQIIAEKVIDHFYSI